LHGNWLCLVARRVEGARGEPVELLHGPVESAAGGVFIARQPGEGLTAALRVGEAEEEGFVVGEPFRFGGLGFGFGFGTLAGVVLGRAGFLDAIEVDAGLDADDAAEEPFGGDGLADEGFLEGVGGLEARGEAGEERVELGLIFDVQDGLAGAETVHAGVLADDGFALGRLWAGGELGITAVCFDLLLGRHENPLGLALTRGERVRGGAEGQVGEGRGGNWVRAPATVQRGRDRSGRFRPSGRHYAVVQKNGGAH